MGAIESCDGGSRRQSCAVRAAKECAADTGVHCGECTNPAESPRVLANVQLLQAASEGNVDKIFDALQAGAQIETRRPAVIRLRDDDEDVECAEEGLSHCPDKDAADEEILDVQGGDVSKAKSSKHQVRSVGMTSVMRAAAEGRAEAVKLLLEFRANPRAKDEDGINALHFAASSGCRHCCQLLLNARASPTVRDDSGRIAWDCIPGEILRDRMEREKWVALLKSASASKSNAGKLP